MSEEAVGGGTEEVLQQNTANKHESNNTSQIDTTPAALTAVNAVNKSTNAIDDGNSIAADQEKSPEVVENVTNSTNKDASMEVVSSSNSTHSATEASEVKASASVKPNDTEENVAEKDITVAASETNKTNSKEDDEYAEHVTYTEDGNAIFTDPKTNYKYKWCTEQNNWVPCDSKTMATNTSANPYENEHYKWCGETQQWLPKSSQTATQAQATETEHYKWNAEKNEWVAKVAQSLSDVTYDIDEDGQRIYTDKDGAVFFWDATKNAWFPKIDDDFMARYQMNYGFIDNTSAGEQEKLLKSEQETKRKAAELLQMEQEAIAAASATADNATVAGAGVKRKVPQEPPKWFEINQEQNTKVYVSNLPLDITLDEFAEVMGKCGMIMRDPQTQKFKLKLYTEADGQIKGDGLCDYIKVESVELALNILDEYDLRGHKLHVQRAKFQMRGEYNPALKPKRKKKDKEKLQKMKEKLFDWRPEKMRGERSKNEKVVIIKNLFHPDIFEKEVQLILDYQNDLREECGKCGTVRKVVIYDRHAEGVAQVNMASPEEADVVIQMMQGRFFGKRQLIAEHWDGKTKYKIAESETEVKKRLSEWDQFLETEEEIKEPYLKMQDSNKKRQQLKQIKNDDNASLTIATSVESMKTSEDTKEKSNEIPMQNIATNKDLTQETIEK